MAWQTWVAQGHLPGMYIVGGLGHQRVTGIKPNDKGICLWMHLPQLVYAQYLVQGNWDLTGEAIGFQGNHGLTENETVGAVVVVLAQLFQRVREAPAAGNGF